MSNNQWIKGKFPCEKCGASKVLYRKWWIISEDEKPNRMGKKYKCLDCDYEHIEDKYYRKRERENE